MKKKIKNIMAEVFVINERLITDDFKQSKSQQWDSLKHISLISTLEDEFDILLEPEEISLMSDFNKIYEVIVSKLKPT